MAATSKSSISAGCSRRISNILGLLPVLLLPASPLRGQEPTVSMKIDVVAWGDDIKGLSFKPGESTSHFTALGFRYSSPVSYSGPLIMEIYQSNGGPAAPAVEPSAQDKAHQLNPLVFEEKSTDPGTKAQPKQGLALELEKRRRKSPALVALAALPAPGCRRATVLLAPADAGTFAAYVIDDDPAKLPLGQLRVHNLSPLLIAIRCNGNPAQELQPRAAMLVPAKNQQLIYELAYKLGDEWKVQENNVIPIRTKEQAQMIILRSQHSFFLSSDGSSGGFLQIVTLRRSPPP